MYKCPPKPGKKESRKRIIDEIEKEPGTFEELKKRTMLSRSTLWKHLGELEKIGQVERQYDSKKRKLLIMLSKKALEPREVFLRKLDEMCTKSLSSEVSVRLKQLLSDRVWSEMLKIPERAKLPYRETFGGELSEHIKYLDFEPFKALIGLWIYHVEKESAARWRKRANRAKIQARTKVIIRRNTVVMPSKAVLKIWKLYRKDKRLAALHFVKKAVVEKEFDELLVEFRKLDLNPLGKLLRAKVMEDHLDYLCRLESPIIRKILERSP